eukprot:557773-Pleurochrysis_carterae.AAC.10
MEPAAGPVPTLACMTAEPGYGTLAAEQGMISCAVVAARQQLVVLLRGRVEDTAENETHGPRRVRAFKDPNICPIEAENEQTVGFAAKTKSLTVDEACVLSMRNRSQKIHDSLEKLDYYDRKSNIVKPCLLGRSSSQDSHALPRCCHTHG